MPIYVISDDFDPITIDNFNFIKKARSISSRYNKLFILVKHGPRQMDAVHILSEFRCVDNASAISYDLEKTLKDLKILYNQELFYISKEGEIPLYCDAIYDVNGKRLK